MTLAYDVCALCDRRIGDDDPQSLHCVETDLWSHLGCISVAVAVCLVQDKHAPRQLRDMLRETGLIYLLTKPGPDEVNS